MAVTLTSADNALKTYYLDAVSEQLNAVNPLLAKIKQSTENVWGKEVKKLAIFGLNGGIGAGTEDGALPSAVGNNYAQFTSTLKNLYGTIEISDKAVRASENNAGAFVNLLNAEMEGLVRASSFNLGRMLFGDGSGKLATVKSIANGVITVDSCRNLELGMIVEMRDEDNAFIAGSSGGKITSLDRANNTFKVTGATITSDTLEAGCGVFLKGSYNNEITGLGAIFATGGSLYGVSRANNSWLSPYVKASMGTLTETAIQTALDTVEENGGAPANMIVCSWGVRRALQKLLSANKRFVETEELAGGYKAISYNGIPVVADRFCPSGTMYILNTDDFTLHQLCDWQWLAGDDGKVLRQVAGKPVYTATLVKYAELICARPYGQGMISGITEV